MTSSQELARTYTMTFSHLFRSWSQKRPYAKNSQIDYHAPAYKHLDNIAHQKLNNGYLQLLEECNKSCKFVVSFAKENYFPSVEREMG